MCEVNGDPSYIRIDWDSPRSLHNWVERLDLVCQPSWRVGLISSMYLLGWAVGCLFIPRLGDLLGRKKPMFIIAAISIFVYLGLILSTNMILTMVLFFLLGMSTPGKSTIGYVLLLELIPPGYQTLVSTIIIAADGSIMIFLSLYFRYITKYWMPFQLFQFGVAVVGFLVGLLAPESPKYLDSIRRFQDAKKSIQTIAKYNGVTMPDYRLIDEPNEERPN